MRYVHYVLGASRSGRGLRECLDIRRNGCRLFIWLVLALFSASWCNRSLATECLYNSESYQGLIASTNCVPYTTPNPWAYAGPDIPFVYILGYPFSSSEAAYAATVAQLDSIFTNWAISTFGSPCPYSLTPPSGFTIRPGIAGIIQTEYATINLTVGPGGSCARILGSSGSESFTGYMYAERKVSCPDGYGFDDWSQLCAGPPNAALQITSPTDQSDFNLTQNNLAGTDNIAFTATSPNNQQISWSLLLEYATSGGKGTFTTTRTFTDFPSNSYDEQYQGMGGRLTVTATQGSSTDKVTVFITGSAIPDDEITNQLVALYGGATPKLMTGIAQCESSYRQFAMQDLYGYNGLWPNESFDGGSHIGLMQMPTTEQTAWDRTANTEQGVNLFMQELATAGRLATRIINSHPGLRALTPVEMEHMAAVLYGPNASAILNAQYYIPSCIGGFIVQGACRGGVWDWQPNDAGNPAGVAYANTVFQLAAQH